MVFIQRKDRAFVELARFGAQQIIINMEMGVKAFKGIESSLSEHNGECFNGSVNVKQCFEYCKATVYKLGKEGLEHLLSGKDVTQNYEASKTPTKLVNHLVPDRWVISVIPATTITPKIYKLFANWVHFESYELSKGILEPSEVKEFEHYYIWNEKKGKSYLLHKNCSANLSESANKAFYLDHVNSVYQEYGDCNVYKPKQMQAFFSSGLILK
ncbi:hypothetical protein [Thalassotalea fusca]